MAFLKHQGWGPVLGGAVVLAAGSGCLVAQVGGEIASHAAAKSVIAAANEPVRTRNKPVPRDYIDEISAARRAHPRRAATDQSEW